MFSCALASRDDVTRDARGLVNPRSRFAVGVSRKSGARVRTGLLVAE
jgi:hypothetical protein